MAAIAAIAGAGQSFSQSSQGEAAKQQSAAIAYKFAAGNSVVYRLHYESRAYADFRVLFQDQKTQAPAEPSSLVYAVSAELNGQWVETTIETDALRIRTLCVLRDGAARLVVNGQNQAAQAETIVANLSRGVVVEQRPDGKVTAIYMNPATDKASSDFALSVFGEMEFVLAGTGGAAAWQSREEDSTGPYAARYQILGTPAAGNSPGAIAIRKTRLRYLLAPDESTLPGQTQMKKQVNPSGSVEARFDPSSGVLISLSGVASQDTVIEDKSVAHSDASVHLERIAQSAAGQDELTQLRGVAGFLESAGSRFQLYTKPSQREMQDNIQRTQLGQETLESLLEQLRAVEASKTKDDQTQLYLKFKALVYLHPESCARLGAVVAAANTQGPSFAILVRALGSIGNAQAQDALVAAIEARPDDLVAVSNLIPTLADAPNPTAAAEAAIRKISSESADPGISAMALLALGSMAHGLQKGSPARSKRIVDDLLRQSAADQPQDRRHDLIEALGNTQSPLALGALSAFATDRAPQLRAAAMDALRFMPAPAADALLLAGLSDADAATRLEAAFGLSFRKMTAASFGAQKKAFAADESEKVRAILLTNLWKVHRQFPEARPLVKSAAEHDASEYVRKLAKGMLLEGQ